MPSQRAINSPLCIIVPPQGETLLVHVSTAHSRCSFQFTQALPGSLPVHQSLIFSTSYGHSRELLPSDSCVSQPETWVPSKESPSSLVLACPSALPLRVLCCWLLLATHCYHRNEDLVHHQLPRRPCSHFCLPPLCCPHSSHRSDRNNDYK